MWMAVCAAFYNWVILLYTVSPNGACQWYMQCTMYHLIMPLNLCYPLCMCPLYVAINVFSDKHNFNMSFPSDVDSTTSDSALLFSCAHITDSVSNTTTITCALYLVHTFDQLIMSLSHCEQILMQIVNVISFINLPLCLCIIIVPRLSS